MRRQFEPIDKHSVCIVFKGFRIAHAPHQLVLVIITVLNVFIKRIAIVPKIAVTFKHQNISFDWQQHKKF